MNTVWYETTAVLRYFHTFGRIKKKYCAKGSAWPGLDLRFSVHFSYYSNIEQVSLTWALFSVPITCISSERPWMRAKRDYTIRRVPQCLSPRPNWVRPPPFPQASVPPSPGQKGDATLACGWGGGLIQFGRLVRKPGTLSTLWLRGSFLLTTSSQWYIK